MTMTNEIKPKVFLNLSRSFSSCSVVSVPAYAASSKCTCPHKEDGHGHSHHSARMHMPPPPMLMPASYVNTLRSQSGGKLSLPPGGSVYAVHPGTMGGYSTMTLGQVQALSQYHNNTLRQQQQQQVYASLPYFMPEDFERR